MLKFNKLFAIKQAAYEKAYPLTKKEIAELKKLEEAENEDTCTKRKKKKISKK